MKFYFLLGILSLSYSFSQDSKKLLTLFGDDFVQMDPKLNYVERLPDNAKIFTSYVWVKEPSIYRMDTTGISNQREYLRFREDLNKYGPESFKFFKKEYVSQNDYWDFIEFVQDSIYREYIYRNNDPTGNGELPQKLLAEMLKFDEKKAQAANYSSKKMDVSDPDFNRRIFSFDYGFDWRKKIDYGLYLPLISSLTLRPYERMDRQKDDDHRKIIYKYDEYPEGINVYPDQSVWAKESRYPNDIHAYLSKFYYLTNNSDPAQGLSGNQIKAYLNYVELELQKKIDQKKLPFHVEVSLPEQNEIDQGEGSEYITDMHIYFDNLDMNSYWQITNGEYYKFLTWVKDSIIRERFIREGESFVQTETLAELLDYQNVFYDESNMQWTEFDPSDLAFCRELFDFNWKKDWRSILPSGAKEQEQLLGSLQPYGQKFEFNGDLPVENIDPNRIFYRYYWKDWGAMSNEVGMKKNGDQNYFEFLDDNWENRRKDRDLGYGVFSNDDLSRFNIREIINVYPGLRCRECNSICIDQHGDIYGDELIGKCDKCVNFGEPVTKEGIYDFKSNPDGLVQNLTYDQAIAFYHWSYVKGFRTPDESPIPEFYCPSVDEFEKVQKGEKIPVKNIKVEYPTPLFRYVVHVYPKK
ncbi:MAG: hypothetical protein KDC84_10755 [Crocinitomicaceae bacterium]|nr:hypothetical protein [Crocinitomicaceae bacterium]